MQELSCHLLSLSKYAFLTKIPCPFCHCDDGFQFIGESLNHQHSLKLIEHVDKKVIEVSNLFTGMVSSFFLHRNKLDHFLHLSKNSPLNEAEEDNVKEFVDFVSEHIGRNHNKSDFAINKKESTHAAKWLIDAGVTSARGSLEKLEKHSSS